MIFYPPAPVDKVHAPLRSNPGSATDMNTYMYIYIRYNYKNYF